MSKQSLAIDSPAPEWLIEAMREAILWSDDEQPHTLMAGVVWGALLSQGLHPYGIGGSKRYSTVPVIVIPVVVESESVGRGSDVSMISAKG